jgi:hypothetical protein
MRPADGSFFPRFCRPGATVSDETNALFDEILRLIEKQLTFLERQTLVTDQEIAEYRERLEEIMKLVAQFPGPEK